MRPINKTFTLPSYWACYLINGDASGMEDDEIKEVDDWLKSSNAGSCVGCSEESEFKHRNDANNLGADCLDYYFLYHPKSASQVYAEIICEVNCKFGAPMGRANVGPVNKPTYVTVFDRKVPLYDGAYDKGGAYWGTPNNLRVMFTEDKSFVKFYRS
jgi:hypothetical protein